MSTCEIHLLTCILTIMSICNISKYLFRFGIYNFYNMRWSYTSSRALNQIQNTRILRSMRLTFLTFGKHKIFKMICVILNFKCGKADCIKEDKHDDIFFFPPLTPYSSRCSVPGEVLESFQAFISAYHYVMAQFALHDMLRFFKEEIYIKIGSLICRETC